MQNLPGVSGAAAAVKKTAAGNQLLVGYIASTDPDFDLKAAHALLSEQLPAALVPRLALMDELPTRTSGPRSTAMRCRGRCPAPVKMRGPRWASTAPLPGLPACGVRSWARRSPDLDDDFFEVGGGSLSAAQLVTALRERFPEVTVAQLYDHPRLGSLAEYLDELAPTETVEPRIVAPTPLKTSARADRRHRSAHDAHRTAVGDVAGDREQRPRLVRRRQLGAHGLVVVDPVGVHRVHHADRPYDHRRRRGAPAPTQVGSQERTREVVVNTCVCG